MTKQLLVIDNYDSFTYNLVHIIRELSLDPRVVRNDQLTLNDVEEYHKILLSPGPGVPRDAGIMPELLKRFASTKSILGVCLGHQAVAEYYGATLYNLPKVSHGIVSTIILEIEDPIFQDIPKQFKACRYHSWVVKDEQMPEDLMVTSRDASGTIMSLKHRSHEVCGVQFHPESIMTEHGKKLMQNWIEL